MALTEDCVAALFVDDRPQAAYVGLPGVEVWGKARDARTYHGPHPVVCHPPCERWGPMAAGGSRRDGGRAKVPGADGGCFAAAIEAVRRWGGVLEHPAGSGAWGAHGLVAPPREGGWASAGPCGGWTCCVEQGHYGHPARKATWLYACGVTTLPSLAWGPSARLAPPLPEWVRRPQKGATPEQRAARRAYLAEHTRHTGKAWCCPEMLSKRERAATPPPFRDLLISIARTARAAERRAT